MFTELRHYHVHPELRDDWVQIMEDKVFPFVIAKGAVIVGSFIGVRDKREYAWMLRYESEEEYDIRVIAHR